MPHNLRNSRKTDSVAAGVVGEFVGDWAPRPAFALLSLTEARNALAQLATDDALGHLEAALRSLEGLANSLQIGGRLQAGEQRLLKRSLLRFRAELRDAALLADQGLAYCQNWAQQMQPSVSYQSNGAFGAAPGDRHELSLEA